MIGTLALILLASSCTANIRTARNAYQFKNVIKCTTEYTIRSILYYNYYGCYCGLNGANNPYNGKDPIDGLDTCCRNHDRCYYDVRKGSECKGKLPHFYLYKWDCIYARDANGSNLSHKVANCTDPQNSCGYQVCQCDKVAADCFAQHPPLSSMKKCPKTRNSTVDSGSGTFTPAYEAKMKQNTASNQLLFSINVNSINTDSLQNVTDKAK